MDKFEKAARALTKSGALKQTLDAQAAFDWEVYFDKLGRPSNRLDVAKFPQNFPVKDPFDPAEARIVFGGTPATIVIRKSPQGAKYESDLEQMPKNRRGKAPSWWDYTAAAMGYVQTKKPHLRMNVALAMKKLKEGPTGWSNRDPKEDSLGFSGGRFKVVGILKDAAQVVTFDVRQAPPDPKKVNPLTHPWLFHLFTVVTRENTLKLPGEDWIGYVPLVTTGIAFVQLKWLRFRKPLRLGLLGELA